jgi:2-iminobutanoate/2-iminopropanoate deaminase
MKRVISTLKAPKAIATYSQAIEVNGFLFISGQVPINPETGKFIDGDIKEQTDQVLKNIGAILESAGYSYKDVIKTTCILSDISNYSQMNEVYLNYFYSDSPARAAFAVKGLPLNALIEIEAIASK